MRDLPERKRTRLGEYDYSAAGAYFVTICTKNRRCILSDIVGGGAPYECGVRDVEGAVPCE